MPPSPSRASEPADLPGTYLSDAVDPDDDNDLLSDVLEVSLGLDPLLTDTDSDGTADGDEDSDGDGQSNVGEALVTLTDPGNANSVFVACIGPLEPQAAGGSLLALTFPSLNGRDYQILAGPTPSALALQTTLTGNGFALSHLIDNNSSEKSFFAVRVLLAD